MANKPPEFKVTARCNLTASHRFGSNLAALLDECVYHNGVHGASSGHLEITCIDTYCTEKEDRENLAEVAAIKDYIHKHKQDLGDFAVLTPYRQQIRALKSSCPGYANRILTVHKSQGREWDTVILSVADNRVKNKDVPLRFTSTKDGSKGLFVINTAVSRAKKRLILVCDKGFWTKQDGELVGKMAMTADHQECYSYKQ